MKTVNVSEMRNVEGGKTYTYWQCRECGLLLGGEKTMYWHVVRKHRKGLLKAWDYIKVKKFYY